MAAGHKILGSRVQKFNVQIVPDIPFENSNRSGGSRRSNRGVLA
jgi:hypothetical protein